MEQEVAEEIAAAPMVLQEVQEEQAVRDAIQRLTPRCAELVKLLFYEQPPVPYKKWRRSWAWPPGPSVLSADAVSTGCRRSWRSWASRCPQAAEFRARAVDRRSGRHSRRRRSAAHSLPRKANASSSQAVESLYDAVVIFARVDLQKAERMAQASSWIAAQINDPDSIAQSARAVGHVLYLTGKYQKAILEYEKALEIFQQIGRDVDYARTISGALQSLIYDGQYERAFRLGEQARTIFHAHKDRLRLARLDSNIANIYYRQDRFQEAVELYEQAYEEFLEYGEPLDIAAVLRNLAVCYYQPE